ncbi:diguanylate cyclase [Cohnella sp.]|uniref:bifunctional diguanylate cyclase/phosphohydrolase n=1 Tax=Cohnella sp. TaxID=1883426 RepID=UPI00356320F6
MGVAQRLIIQLRQPGHTYALLVCFAGAILFVTINKLPFLSYSLSEWIMIYAMVASVVILEHFMFQLPPEGNRQSMDSSVYLAALFAFGGSFSLTILLMGTFILMLHKREVKWWKHLLNFSIYTFMISCASITFYLLGGKVGSFNIQYLHAYVIALAVYFIVNCLFVGFYYFLLYKGKLYQIIKTILTDVVFAYFSTLLLSIVLLILIVSSRLFGLFLLLAVGMLLSHGFRQLFKMYNEMSEKANTDQRTGLYSHSYFEEKLDEYMKQAREKEEPLSLAMLDLDDFKKYNDAYGHPQGDRLLGFFGRIVKEECEPHQLFVARYGGEEFSVIMPGFTKDRAKEFVDRLRKKINDTPFEGVDIFPHGCISFSAGVMEVNKDTYDKSQLIDWADRALYVAKSKGKNTVMIYGVENHLPQSLEQDINEIEQHIKIFLSKDVYTFKHSKRVFSYAVDMAEVLNLNEEDRRLLVLGALIHDIGKLEIPRDILNKKSKLTNEEWEIVKKHVLWGKEIVMVTEKYKDLVPLVELHHERFDGKGYPHGLKNNEIPRLARLLCIIDSFDAMTTERPYQETKSFEEALNELKRCTGSQFDPELVGYFIQYIEDKMFISES